MYWVLFIEYARRTVIGLLIPAKYKSDLIDAVFTVLGASIEGFFLKVKESICFGQGLRC